MLIASPQKLSRYKGAAAIIAAVSLFQIIVLSYASSLALLGDTLHSVSDFATLFGTALLLFLTLRRGMGSPQVEKVWLLVGVVTLFAGGGYIVFEAIERVRDPIPFSGVLVVIAALGGMVGNYAAHRLLEQVQKHEHDAVHKNAHDHVRTDMMMSGAVFLSGALVFIFELPALDGFIALLVGPLMMYLAWKRWRERDAPDHSH